MRLMTVLLTVLVLAAWTHAQPATRPTTQPTFVELPAMQLAGIACFGTPEHGMFGELWKTWPQDVQKQPGMDDKDDVAYGLSLQVPSREQNKSWQYYAAARVADPAKVPLHLLRFPVPAGTYAIFRLEHGMPEGLKEFGPMFNVIYRQWLPGSEYVQSAPFDIERYTFKGDVSVIEILIPVKKK